MDGAEVAVNCLCSVRSCWWCGWRVALLLVGEMVVWLVLVVWVDVGGMRVGWSVVGIGCVGSLVCEDGLGECGGRTLAGKVHSLLE